MIVFSIKLAIGVALFTVVTAAMILQSTRRIYHLGGVMKSESRIATSTFLDGLNGLRSVRSIGGERYVVELDPPSIPQQYASSVIAAYRRTRLTSARAVELLHDTLAETDLPEPDRTAGSEY